MNYLIILFFVIAFILLTMWLGIIPAIILLAIALIPARNVFAI